jgi:SET domain-containing protein
MFKIMHNTNYLSFYLINVIKLENIKIYFFEINHKNKKNSRKIIMIRIIKYFLCNHNAPLQQKKQQKLTNFLIKII